MRSKLIVYDWNGTLLNDLQHVFPLSKIFVNILDPGRNITLDEFLDTFQVPIVNFALALGITREAFERKHSEAFAFFNPNVEIAYDRCELRSGAAQALNWFKALGAKQIILSNHSTVDIERQLVRFGINYIFNKASIIGREYDSHIYKGGKGTKLEAFMREQGYVPENVIIVGDLLPKPNPLPGGVFSSL